MGIPKVKLFVQRMIHMSILAKLRLLVISISLVTLGILWEKDPKLSKKFS